MEPTGRALPDPAQPQSARSTTTQSNTAPTVDPPPDIDTSRWVPPRAAPADDSLRHLLRFVYTHNPFYVISAACVFYGLRVTFDDHWGELDTFALLAALAVYTVVLAVTAWAIVRWGGVWQDARSLLVLVVVSLLSMSMTFDDRLVVHRSAASACFLLGLVFAIVISEGVLRALRMRLPLLYRIPYHLLLALFFLYPLWLASADPLVSSTQSGEFDSRLRLLGFPLVAGALMLTLWPAIRRGPWYVRSNGTPWGWPLYPGVLFGVLAFGACARAHCLTISFDLVPGTSGVFDWYFLVPVLFACAVLLLEAGVASRSSVACNVALVAPLVLALFAVRDSSSSPVAEQFRSELTAAYGSPLFWTTLAAVVFFGVAALRQIAGGLAMLVATSAVYVVVGPGTEDLATLAAPSALALTPLLGIAVWRGWRQPSAAHHFLISIVTIAIASLVLKDTPLTTYGLAIPLHRVWLAAVIVAAMFADQFARTLRYASAAALGLAGILVLAGREPLFPDISQLARLAYLAALIAAAALVWSTTRRRIYLSVGMINLLLLLLASSVQLYEILHWRVEGLKPLLWGVAFFLLAVVISFAKGGIWQSLSSWASRLGPARGPDG
jgi:hypothetical protein